MISTFNYKIFPNPTNQEISFDFYKSSLTDMKIIKIYNLTGKELLSMNTFQNIKINVGWLQNGIYLVKIVYKNSNYFDKFIKK